MSFAAINIVFVAIETLYCHNLHGCCNMAPILRQPNFVARVSLFVAIEAISRNKIAICGNIQKDIATTLLLCDRYKYCCKKMAYYCNKLLICRNSVYFSPRFHHVAITIVYCDKLCIRGNM